LLDHKFGPPFSQPVDPVKLNLPDYHNVITKPMDLGTVKNKLEAGEYPSTDAVAEDIRTIWKNAMQYNPPNSDIYHMASELSDVFEKKYKHVPKVSEFDDNRPQKKAMEKKYEDLQKQVEWMQRELETMKSGGPVPSRPGMGARRPGGAKSDRMNREMTFEEKRQLSLNINKLPNDKIGRVVSIIRQRMPQLVGEDDEIEVDIDALDNSCLRYLEEYVSQCLKKPSASAKTASRPKPSSQKPQSSNSESFGTTAAAVKKPKSDSGSSSAGSGSSSSGSSSSGSGSDSDSGSDSSDDEGAKPGGGGGGKGKLS